MVYSHNGIFYNNEDEQTTTTSNNVPKLKSMKGCDFIHEIQQAKAICVLRSQNSLYFFSQFFKLWENTHKSYHCNHFKVYSGIQRTHSVV